MIRWEDPPRANTSWKAVAEELKERPGCWARVLEPTTKSRADAVYTHLRKHGAEAVVRKVSEEGSGVWARWPSTPCAVHPHLSTGNTHTNRSIDPQSRHGLIDV